jgi:hypothetical protein
VIQEPEQVRRPVSSHRIADAPELQEPARLLRDQLAAGQSIDEALTTLRAHTKGFIHPIGGAMIALGLSLMDARELIETSPAFAAEQQPSGSQWAHDPRAERRRLFLERIAPQIEAARQPPGQDPDYTRNDLDETDHDEGHRPR